MHSMKKTLYFPSKCHKWGLFSGSSDPKELPKIEIDQMQVNGCQMLIEVSKSANNFKVS